MTEKEKQQAGELYNGNDRELFAERIAAKKLCAEYNAVPYNDFQKRDRLLDRLIAFHGENSRVPATMNHSNGMPPLPRHYQVGFQFRHKRHQTQANESKTHLCPLFSCNP
jgi:hypothetical protein